MDNLSTKMPSTNRPPPTVFCYICSRQFGSKSIAIHEPQCLKKWHIDNAKLPPNQRRKEPVKPDIPIGGGNMTAEEVNEAAWQASQQNLVACENCGRTFNPDRLAAHQKSCRPGNEAAAPPKKK